MSLRPLIAGLVMTLAATACTAEEDALVVYTSVTQATVDAVVAEFDAAGVQVEVFRAPTGEVNARIAAERREGGLRADVLWLTDPLSMQAYDSDGLLRPVEPDVSTVPEAFRADRFWGTRILNLVIVAGESAPPITTWDDLVDAAAAGGVAIPDPAFAGSAFAALGFFALDDRYGMEFLRRLRDAGGTQVGTPGDVVTGVAEGAYAAGITLDFSARTAVEKGSPLRLIWPEPGAIALYSPIAVTGDHPAAVEFVSHVVGPEAQAAIAATGWQPVDPSIPWTAGGPQVTVAWDRASDRQEELLAAYRDVFGG